MLFAICALAVFVIWEWKQQHPIVHVRLFKNSNFAVANILMLTLGAAWGLCIEVARNHAGVVGAVMNTSGQIASMVMPLVIGYSVEWFNNWDFPIYMLACMFLGGAVCWLLIDPHKPVFEEAAA